MKGIVLAGGTDAGTFDSLRHATNLVAETGANKLPSTTAVIASTSKTH